VKVGDLLAGRYLLLEAISGAATSDATTSPAVVWRAQDEVLARAVAVKCLATPNKAARDGAGPFLEAAARLGGINHPGVVKVYDAAIETRPGRGNDVAYVISEWIDGEALDLHLLRTGPLAAPDATDVLRQAADAVTALHAGRLLHGRLHPGNVLVTASGRVRITDAAVALALQDVAAAAEPEAAAAPPVDVEATPSGVAADTRDLAAVLYALTTQRWPSGATPQPAGALAPAPLEGGQVLAPRQLRAAIPRAVDSVVLRALEPQRVPAQPPIRTPSALADAADSSVSDLRSEQVEAEAKQVRPAGRIRKALPWVVAAAFIGAVGVIGWTVGLAVGDLPPPTNAQVIVNSPEPAAPGVVRHPVKSLAGVVVHDFDPLGRGRTENPDQVPNATDLDPTTSWFTEQYRSSDFSGLKPGVGLLLDFGKPTAFHSVSVLLTAPGTTFDVRVSDTAPTSADDMRRVAAGDVKAANVTRTLPSAPTGRYLLLWITGLPKDGSSYRVGVSELRFT
jgi:serine/threonine protein kinase